MYFSKFNDAAADLMASYHKNKNNTSDLHRDHAGLSRVFSECIMSGQRFFLPSASSILTGKVVSPETKFYMKNLPFDCVVLLSDTYLSENCLEKNEFSIPSWKISIAIDIHGEINNRLHLFPPEKAQKGDYIVSSVVFDPGYRLWAFQYAYAISYHPLEAIGYTKRAFSGSAWFDYCHTVIGLSNMQKEMEGDLGSIQNLCLMLGLKNVTTQLVEPARTLNKNRERKGKPPLYSYRVLNVDNSPWDHSDHIGGSRQFNGRRSHFRRGHIRMLANGNRIWVRAALVSGSIPGFSDKEYHLSESLGSPA